jgi:hypothetical protein
MINERDGNKILDVLEEYNIYRLEQSPTSRWVAVNSFDPGRFDYNDSVAITTTPVQDFQVTLTEHGLKNLADDVQEYRDMRQFMRGNPQIRHEFEKWQIVELLRRS